jgi:hypothetical protein
MNVRAQLLGWVDQLYLRSMQRCGFRTSDLPRAPAVGEGASIVVCDDLLAQNHSAMMAARFIVLAKHILTKVIL